MKAVVFNLGCKVNQYESDVLTEELIKRGYEVSAQLSGADLYIINTCAVTGEAERKSRQAVARARKFNPHCKIIVIGCASEKAAKDFLKDNVVFISGTADKLSALNYVGQDSAVTNVKPTPGMYENTALHVAGRTRAYIKIQDGCDCFCSYCIVPYLRGRSRSRPIAEVANEAKTLSEKVKELVLTGINLSAYGNDIGTDLAALITALKGIRDARIRLGSFYVEGVSPKLLDALFSLENFCPHFHLSLQSGSAGVLKAMNRHYTPQEYLDKVNLIRQYDGNASITTDIIAGYPTETESEFLETLEFVKKAGFSDIHVFPYSPREGTAAYALAPLCGDVVNYRRKLLLAEKARLRKNYLNKNIGVAQDVIFEETDGEYNVGYSQRYIRIYSTKRGQTACIMPTAIYKDGLRGE